MASLSDRAGFLIVANIIKFAIGIVMPLVVVRMLSRADYGAYQQMVLIGNSVTGLLTFGLPMSVFYFYHHVPKERLPTLVGQTSMALAIGGVIAAVFIFVGGPSLAKEFHTGNVANLFALYGISVGFLIAGEHSMPFLLAQNRYGLAVGFELCEVVVRVLLLLTPLWLGYGFPGLIVGIIVYSAVRLLGRSVYLFTRSGLDFSGWSRHLFLKEQFAYGIPMAAVSLVSLLGGVFNRGIIAARFTPSDYAVYSVGNFPFPFATVFQSSVAAVLRASLPALVRDGELVQVARLLRESVRKLSMIVLPSFVFLYGHSYQVITTLFTTSYIDSVNLFRIFLWELPLDIFILSSVPQVFGKTRVNMYINFGGTAILVGSSYLLVNLGGLYGAAIAAVGTQWICSTIFLIMVRRLTQSSIGALVPIPAIVRVISASLISVIASLVAQKALPAGLVGLLGSAAVFSGTFVVAAPVVGVVTPEDRQLIGRWLLKVPLAKRIWKRQ